MKYFEIVFGWNGLNPRKDMESICIKGMRRPSIAEAKEFCEEDMERMGCNSVWKVREISRTEAEDEFDLSNEDMWPVFAEEEYEYWGEECFA